MSDKLGITRDQPYCEDLTARVLYGLCTRFSGSKRSPKRK